MKRLNSRTGFTLAEVLITVLILLMITAVVAGGMPVAANAYYKVVDAANAQVLLSTAMTELRDQLGLASGAAVESGALTYAGPGGDSRIWLGGDGTILLRQTIAAADRPLVSVKAQTKNLTVTYTSVTVDGTLVTFEDLRVEKKGRSVAALDEYCVRTGK
ncbi:MAG: type II secretion system protein [Ruminococcaceae bacterium]|jgi:prepilin-type N-terminal cleavage/methylation domain-containing protein|nr:type II secretion system protein [Oscillospiraceae bacterium]MBQ5973160.1 type II secretion system protein [Oscillospiraceae bacterium]